MKTVETRFCLCLTCFSYASYFEWLTIQKLVLQRKNENYKHDKQICLYQEVICNILDLISALKALGRFGS